jgi:hypothetical protein
MSDMQRVNVSEKLVHSRWNPVTRSDLEPTSQKKILNQEMNLFMQVLSFGMVHVQEAETALASGQ